MVKAVLYLLPPLVAMISHLASATEPTPSGEDSGRRTLGGTQYWTDHFVCHGWRIQRNVVFGQYRLLKPTDRVARTGNYDQCRQAFESVRQEAGFPAIASTVLVTLHGLGRTRNSMEAMGKYVSEEGGFGWVNVGYASTRSKITAHVQALRNALDELARLKREQDNNSELTDGRKGIQFHFVAHSLGNIIIRHMLWEIEQDKSNQEKVDWRPGRMVMLGPPNQGSATANLLRNSNVFRVITGASGQDLGAEWNKLRGRLTTPSFEFAIIAGGKGDGRGYNPLLAGDDDLIVRVDETKLPGAADFTVIPSVHTYLMERKESREMALRFLQMGFLKSPAERNRIPPARQ